MYVLNSVEDGMKWQQTGCKHRVNNREHCGSAWEQALTSVDDERRVDGVRKDSDEVFERYSTT